MFLKPSLIDYIWMMASPPHTKPFVKVCLKIQSEEGDNEEGQRVRQIRAYVINDQDIRRHYS